MAKPNEAAPLYYPMKGFSSISYGSVNNTDHEIHFHKKPEKLNEIRDLVEEEEELRRLSPSDRTSQTLLLAFIAALQCMGSVAYGYNCGIILYV